MMRTAMLLSALALVGPATFAGGNEEPTADDFATLRKDVDTLLKKSKLDFYGHFKLDSSRDQAETNFGNTAFFVKDYSGGSKDDEMNITARHTRLGMNWNGPEFNGIKATGKIELDFLGKATPKNTETFDLQSGPRLRHAWMRFDFPSKWSLTAGQTWDVFAPLNMKKLNTLVGWGQGNVAFRRPMLQVSRKFKAGETPLTAKFALARAVARDNGLDGDTQDDGEDAGVPDIQAYLGASFDGPAEKPIKVGLGGFIGKRELGAGGATLTEDVEYDANLFALDFTVPVTDEITLLGELWTGSAMDGYRGGVWQSYSIESATSVSEIGAKGGWLNVIWKPEKKWTFVAGFGLDDPENDDFIGGNPRLKNTTTFANARYSFYKGATVGLEFDSMETTYSGGDAKNNRIQVTFALKF